MTLFGGRACLVTGAASGLGRSLAFAAADRGATMVLTDICGDGLKQTVDEIRGQGGVVAFAGVADLRDHDAVAELARRTHDELDTVDIVMNVAGTSIWGSVERLTPEHWRQMIDVNLMGPIHVVDAFVPTMIRAGSGGHIVNVASAAGLFGLPWHAAYSASKFGLRGVSEVLRFDLRQHRIGVSLVTPGAIDTPLVRTVNVVGVDRESPKVQRFTRLFTRHAVSPDSAARTIIRGVERDRYLIFTSNDIRVGHWLQRTVPPVYELAMRGLNRAATRLFDTEPALTEGASHG